MRRADGLGGGLASPCPLFLKGAKETTRSAVFQLRSGEGGGATEFGPDRRVLYSSDEVPRTEFRPDRRVLRSPDAVMEKIARDN